MTARTTTIASLLSATFLAACTAPQVKPPSSGHINADSAPPAAKSNIPSPVQQSVTLPAPKPAAKVETYSVVVKDVRVQELLFALARDAKLNVDIHPGISGTVTLNAIDQTLPQLLNRIAKQTDMRFELDGPNLVVMPDTPYLRTYKVDYVNMTRDTTGNVAINTQIASISPTTYTLSRDSQMWVLRFQPAANTFCQKGCPPASRMSPTCTWSSSPGAIASATTSPGARASRSPTRSSVLPRMTLTGTDTPPS